MKPKKQGFPINPNPGPPPIIYCVHCGTALVNGKCPKGHEQAPKGDDGRVPDPHTRYFRISAAWWEAYRAMVSTNYEEPVSAGVQAGLVAAFMEAGIDLNEE